MGLTPQLWSAAEYHQNLLAPVGEVVIGMERTGIPVDKAVLQDIEVRMAEKAAGHLKELADWRPGDINWNSWVQLANWMHGPEKWPEGPDEAPLHGPQRTLGMEHSPYCKKGKVPDGKISTDDRALEWLAGHNPEHRSAINALRQLRQAERMGRYARDWLDKALPHGDGTWRLHPSFGLATDHDTRPGAVTGRFGVKNPPLNQVPRNPLKDPAGMRTAFVPPPGMRLVVVDYAQLEVVIIAHIISILFNDSDPLVTRVRSGADVHGPLAHYIFGTIMGDKAVQVLPPDGMKKHRSDLRELAKVAIYRANYGGNTAKGYAFSTFMPDGEPLGMKRGQALVDGLAGFYPGVLQYQAFIRKMITRVAHITTLFGRWQPLPNAKSSTTRWVNQAWRQALNFPMQGGGQEIMAMALIAIANDFELHCLGFRLSLVVHDEVVGWAPEANAERAMARVIELLTQTVQLAVPLRAEGHTGNNWKECK